MPAPQKVVIVLQMGNVSVKSCRGCQHADFTLNAEVRITR